MNLKKILFTILFIGFTNSIFAHVGNHSSNAGITFTIKDKKVIGNFLMEKDGKVFIELTNGKITSFAIEDFSFSNQKFLGKKKEALKQINTIPDEIHPKKSLNVDVYFYLLIASGLWFLYLKNKRHKLLFGSLFISTFLVLYACKNKEDEPAPNGTSTLTTLSKTDPSFIEKVYSPYKSEVKTRFDDTYFYVETEGIPQTHNMMVGISNWQQQVPIPQGYTGTNAWSIPLKPEFASAPLSLKSNFMKGAVAIAANGIPIFNPLNNRGEDAFLIGELDQWGGHCGKADDYHYHIAPMHFEATAGNNPIAMALDGFAIYGTKEPDGTSMKTLDEYHGHAYNNSYHYHAETKYPYFMAAMRGKVSLDPSTPAPENQIIPQAKSNAVRPALTPLKGASITAFKSTGINAYSLEYTIENKKAYINYSWDNGGNYSFVFIGTDGKSTTSKYNKK